MTLHREKPHPAVWILFSLAACIGPAAAQEPSPAIVRDADGLRQAVAKARPGSTILLEPGDYPGGLHFANLRGEEKKPIAIRALDPENPPVFRGGPNGMQLSDPAHVVLESLVIAGATSNGLNIDDGGSYDTPAHHVTLRRIQVRDIGPRGNRDGIKLSGLDDFLIEECRIERWGVGGSGIDMVGCHRGTIQDCLFRHIEVRESNGIQAKGGSREIAIRRNRFEDAGGRGVNIGGSTGLQFFRPPLGPGRKGDPSWWEAKDIRVEGNTFVGCGAPVAFINVDGASVRWNTIYRPRRWALRILQESQAPEFIPSRNGEFSGNIVAFRSDELAEAVNIGPRTAPGTFRFKDNIWFCLDRPERSRPRLPAEETGGTYGQDPLFKDAEKGDLSLLPGSPAQKAGAGAIPPR